MNLQVKQVTTFLFSRVVGDTNYSFSITAATHAEACKKLAEALTVIIEEVKAMTKVPTAA